jgi:hypothetical protein
VTKRIIVLAAKDKSSLKKNTSGTEGDPMNKTKLT